MRNKTSVVLSGIGVLLMGIGVALMVIGLVSQIAAAEQPSRLPPVPLYAQTTTLKCGLLREDTLTVNIRNRDGTPDQQGSFVAVIQSDSEVYYNTKADTVLKQGMIIPSGWSWNPDPHWFQNGDTINVHCKACTTTDTATVNIRFYRAGNKL